MLEVMKRDNWKCRMCGCRDNLQAHHIKFRSSGGDDTRVNLITLCAKHHAMVHDRDLILLQNNSTKEINADNKVVFEKLQ